MSNKFITLIGNQLTHCFQQPFGHIQLEILYHQEKTGMQTNRTVRKENTLIQFSI